MYNFAKDYRDERYILIFWVGLFVVMLLRNFYFGFTYFHFLDDYNTYGVFNRRNADIWNDIILYYPHFSWRPFATFSDAYITQWFWPSMQWVLLFYTVMHFATVVIFHRVMVRSGLNFSLLGIVIVSLTPILSEAVYWIGASTRLVPGMFFSILSVYFLLIHIKNAEKSRHGKRYLLLYMLFNFVGMGFYEQIMVFNLVFTLLIVLVNNGRIYKNKRLIWATPVINTVLMIMYYVIMAPFGRVGARTNIVSIGEFIPHVIQTTMRIGNLLVVQNYDISSRGFVRGLSLINGFFGIVAMLFVVLFTVFTLFSYVKTYIAFEDESYERYILRIIIGLVLIFAPFGPFFILEPQWLPPRTLYPSIFGIAIFLDTLLALASKFRFMKLARKIVPVVFIIPFFIIYIAEVNNYRLLEEVDTLVMDNFLTAFYESGHSDDNTVVLFNTRIVIADVTGGGSPYRLENVTTNNWAMQGKANAVSYNFRFTDIQTIRDGWLVPAEWLDNGVLFGLDEELNVLHLARRGNGLYTMQNELFGRVEVDSNDASRFYFTFAGGRD